MVPAARRRGQRRERRMRVVVKLEKVVNSMTELAQPYISVSDAF